MYKESGMMNRSINDVYELMHNADENKKAGRFQEAADKYYEAAELDKGYDVGYLNIISNFESAAECYLKTKDIRSCECYNKAIDVYVKNGQINQAIQRCFEYGYLLFTEYEEQGQSENFYRKGDDLQLQHNLKHTCVITKFDVSEFKKTKGKPLYGAINDAVQLRRKVNDLLI
ncbi:hypothetical protein RF11_00957 [Thelohanellus kitauei]|uniref:Uncharacterized protein n=1 Tax=Thelohanellus kitauei TaxID=669202 RepID=A0A0C2JRR0_THEKT|nr:hypothetical protein RF11_00957 [Thelohanellus kitauei]